MTEVATRAPSPTELDRELTDDELANLDRLRAVLASAVDRTEPAAVSGLWDTMVAAHGGHAAPAGFVEAVATALGDLLAVHVPSAHWSVWPGPAGPTPGVSSQARPHSPVVPFVDARDRWDAQERDWVAGYLARAAAHLGAAAVPQPRVAPDDDVAVAQVAPAAPPVPAIPLEDFALDALDHAMSLLRETGAFDHEVFVLLLDGTGRRTESCPGSAAEARARAGELVRASGAERAAVTWIDRDPVDLPGPRQAFPAVLVDAWDAGTEGVRVGRRFVDDVLGIGPIGGRLVVGPVAPLL